MRVIGFMSKSNKGKTQEEIYGIEGAKKRRDEIAKKRSLGLLKKSTKGKTWEEIYTPEEVKRRREQMKYDNPFHKMTSETAKIRSKKLSDNMKKTDW